MFVCVQMMEIMLVSSLKWDIAANTPYDVMVQILARLPIIDQSVRSRIQTTAHLALSRFASGAFHYYSGFFLPDFQA